MSRRAAGVDARVRIDLYTSAFCAPCHAARRVVGHAGELVSALEVEEFDVAAHPQRAEADAVRSTPTIVVRRDDGAEVFRAAGVPTEDQLLRAVALALD